MLSRKIKKIMLVFPRGKALKGHFHYCQVPMGIAYLAAALRGDFAVEVLDGRAKFQTIIPREGQWEYFGYTQQELFERIIASRSEVVGISCLFSHQAGDVLDLCRRIKDHDPRIITVIGGAHPTFLAETIMREHSPVDFVVLGEGEQTLPELVRRIDAGEDYRQIDGLAFRENGGFRINPKTGFIHDLDTLAFPAYDLLPLEFYEKKAVPFSVTFRSKKNAPIVTSRGCTSKCVFCASRNYWGNTYRMRSAENVLDEIELLVKKYGRREIQFIDDNLTLNKQRAMRIFQGIIDRKLKIHWNTPNGIAIWTVDEEMLDAMKASGCYELTIAFESGDQEVLNKIIKKPLNLEKAGRLVGSIRKRGILTYGFFISGFPGEKKEQVRRTFAFAKEMDLDGAAFFIANPTPGSDLYKICLEKGYIKNDFSFGSIEYNWPNFGTDDMSAEELERFVLNQFNAYLLRVFLRHPLRFLNKYLRVFLTHPVMSVRTTWADIERLIVQSWKKEKKSKKCS